MYRGQAGAYMEPFPLLFLFSFLLFLRKGEKKYMNMFGCGNGEDQRRVGLDEQYNQNAFYVQIKKPVQNKIQNIF